MEDDLDLWVTNPLNANLTEWSTPQIIRRLLPNCLSVFDHFVGLGLEGLTIWPNLMQVLELTKESVTVTVHPCKLHFILLASWILALYSSCILGLKNKTAIDFFRSNWDSSFHTHSLDWVDLSCILSHKLTVIFYISLYFSILCWLLTCFMTTLTVQTAWEISKTGRPQNILIFAVVNSKCNSEVQLLTMVSFFKQKFNFLSRTLSTAFDVSIDYKPTDYMKFISIIMFNNMLH